MLTYEYRCENCSKEFETERKINDLSAVKCPYCGSNTTKRLISSGNFLLKGEGWAKDGYA